MLAGAAGDLAGCTRETSPFKAILYLVAVGAGIGG